MKVFVAVLTDGSELCHPIAEGDSIGINQLINGQTRAATWEPMPVELVREDEGRRMVESDSPWFGESALIFRSSAVLAMGSLLRLNGELLPLRTDGVPLYIYNPTNVLDALDESESSLQRLRSGKIVRVTRHVFRHTVVAGQDVFKITSLLVSPTFVSDRFVEQWRAAGLRGLEFGLVWSSAD